MVWLIYVLNLMVFIFFAFQNEVAWFSLAAIVFTTAVLYFRPEEKSEEK